MSSDRGLEVTRAVRAKISREHGNDPRRLVEHYLAYQAQFADRLRRAPAADQAPGEDSGPAAGADAGPAQRGA